MTVQILPPETEIVISWLGRRMARIRAFNFLDFSKLILFAKKKLQKLSNL
jgi:hypothetical protein